MPRTEYTVTNLDRGQTYSFQLRAVNTAGAGPSTINQLTTENIAITPPAPAAEPHRRQRREAGDRHAHVGRPEPRRFHHHRMGVPAALWRHHGL